MAQAIEKETKKKAANKKSIDKETILKWYRLMLRIRKFEERAGVMYGKQKIRGFFHVYIGQEAIAAGLDSALRPEDALVTAYRQHGIALMKGLDMNSCMAELYGKETGAVKGKGGSMHFFSKEHRYFGGNGIVGAQIPIGAGIAFAEKYKGTDNLCVTMFGDGAARQGALYEGFNMAMTWKLPALFICENNQYAMGTSVERTSNVHDIYKVGHAFEMPSEEVDGMDPEAVHHAIAKAAAHIRAGKGPYFLEIKTYRYKGHSVSDPAKYREKSELNEFKALDPIKTTERRLVEENHYDQEFIDTIKKEVKAEVDAAIEFAENSNFPDPSELFTDNYVQKDYPFLD